MTDKKFEVLMQKYGEMKGRQYMEEAERLKNDPDFVFTEELDRKCREAMEKAFSRGDGQYHSQSIDLVLERDSEVFQRLETLSRKTGKSVEELFDWAVGLGIEEHLKKTVGVLERIHDIGEE